jgi:hypothetical protein
MRRVVWSVLTGLGAFFIVLAIMSWLYVPGQAVKFPLNEYSLNTLVANNASWFSPKSVSELSNVTLQITSTVKGDVTAANTLGSSKYAVWQSFAAVEDTTDHQQVSIPAAASEFAFDRRTGALIPWSGNQIDGKPVKNVSGQGFVWPLGAKKQSYQVFDTTLLKPVTFKFVSTATTSGVAEKAPTVTLPEMFSTTETYYVDPVTGAPLQIERNTHEVLADASGATKLVLLDADFKTSAASVAATIKSDNHYRNLINLATFTVPVIAGLVGIILLVIGLVLSRMSPEDEEYEDEDEPVGASA